MPASNYDYDGCATGDLMTGYSTLVQQRVDAGWNAYLVTMTFVHLRGKPETVLHQMFDEAQHFYQRFVTRVVRRPRVASSTRFLPVLIVAPDVPVGKSDKPLRDVVLNNGLHLHGVLLVPPRSRLRTPADEHVRSFQAFYLGAENNVDGVNQNGRRLAAIDLRPIQNDVDRVVSYALKGLMRRRFTPDQLLVLPRARSELPTKHTVGSRRRRCIAPLRAFSRSDSGFANE